MNISQSVKETLFVVALATAIFSPAALLARTPAATAARPAQQVMQWSR